MIPDTFKIVASVVIGLVGAAWVVITFMYNTFMLKEKADVAHLQVQINLLEGIPQDHISEEQIQQLKDLRNKRDEIIGVD